MSAGRRGGCVVVLSRCKRSYPFQFFFRRKCDFRTPPRDHISQLEGSEPGAARAFAKVKNILICDRALYQSPPRLCLEQPPPPRLNRDASVRPAIAFTAVRTIHNN